MTRGLNLLDFRVLVTVMSDRVPDEALIREAISGGLTIANDDGNLTPEDGEDGEDGVGGWTVSHEGTYPYPDDGQAPETVSPLDMAALKQAVEGSRDLTRRTLSAALDLAQKSAGSDGLIKLLDRALLNLAEAGRCHRCSVLPFPNSSTRNRECRSLPTSRVVRS